MLGKLLKYEIKATGRIFLPLFLAILVFAGITRAIAPLGPERFGIPSMISMAIYIVILVGTFVMTFVVMIQRFYRNLLSDEGYLMFTLPTKPWMHIVSKLLVSMFWILASSVTAMISIMIIAYERGTMAQIAQGFVDFLHRVNVDLGASAYLLTLELIIGILIGLASSILIVYASIAVGHLSNKYKMLASFGAFIVLNTVSQIVVLLISLIPGISYFSNIHISGNDITAIQSTFELTIGYGIFLAALISAAYFIITNTILSKRLNLE